MIDIPAAVVDQVGQVGHAVITQAFVDAVRPSMALPIAILIVAAMSSLAARSPRRVSSREPRAQTAVA